MIFNDKNVESGKMTVIFNDKNVERHKNVTDCFEDGFNSNSKI